MLTIHTIGRWEQGAVVARFAKSSRPVVPEVEAAIERAWAAKGAEPGVYLFDGRMCRLEAWEATPAALSLTLSSTTYKSFLGTNMANPDLADRYGREILANPLGTCVALETSDARIVLGRRNASVAYYPDRVHPVAGALEPEDDGDVFKTVRRELSEELALPPADVADLACLGLVEDHSLRQPELVFRARAARTFEQIRATVDKSEHHSVIGVTASAPGLDHAIQDPALTPVAVGCLLLWGRDALGEAWFRPRRDSLRK